MLTTTDRIHLIAVLTSAALAACGGGKKADTTPEPAAEAEQETAPAQADAPIVAADTMDEIQRLFDRKRGAVSRCLSAAVDSKELPKNSHGKVTLGVVIGTSGSASDIKVIHATLESQSLTSCVIEKVKEIQFPEVPKPYETSYTYAFEAM